MKTLIIYESVHHRNTQKIAKAIAKVLNATLLKPNEVDINNLKEYDLIGFGSGIYAWRHHRSLLKLANKLPTLNKKAFIFSTAGSLSPSNHNSLRKKLTKKYFKIIKEFSCKGFDTVGPLKLFGGINKGRPNEQDLENARAFAKTLK